MKPVQIEKTKSTSVSCSGRDVPYDHPRVFLEINSLIGKIDCPYCGKCFELED
jgi:uncharacterized Zn-finger protein